MGQLEEKAALSLDMFLHIVQQDGIYGPNWGSEDIDSAIEDVHMLTDCSQDEEAEPEAMSTR